MARVRLIADDLTGALDTAAELVALAGPVAVRWGGVPSDAAGSLALNIGTREGPRHDAVTAAAAAAPALAEADIAFLKVDSLLRGHGMAELGACLSLGGFAQAVVAPAFPHQDRVTRGGVQYRLDAEGGWRPAADVLALLAEAGVPARLGDPAMPLAAGVSVFDAETEADLDRVAALATGGRVLWCGSAGLALALGRRGAAASRAPVRLSGPVLGLFGSDQPATAAQLAACGALSISVPDGSGASAARVAAALARHGAALVSLALPDELHRAEAAARIAVALGALALALPPPGTLFVAGGETLRGLCVALGADRLDAVGQVEPGLPISVMRGGRWDGLRVVSKSGAFGGPTLWRDLVAPFLLTADKHA